MNRILDPHYHRKSVLKEIGNYIAGILLLIGLFIVVLLLVAYLGMTVSRNSVNAPAMRNHSSEQVRFTNHHDHRIDEWS